MFFISDLRMTLSKFARDIILGYVKSAPDIKEILDPEEIQHVRDRNQSNVLKSRFFEPQHARPRKTYRIQINIDESFDLYKFIDEITEHLTGHYEIQIDLGYFALKPFDNDTLRFIFPAKCTSFINQIVTDPESHDKLMTQVKNASSDILLTAFISHQQNKDFAESGFVPRSPVMLETFITTF